MSESFLSFTAQINLLTNPTRFLFKTPLNLHTPHDLPSCHGQGITTSGLNQWKSHQYCFSVFCYYPPGSLCSRHMSFLGDFETGQPCSCSVFALPFPLPRLFFLQLSTCLISTYSFRYFFKYPFFVRPSFLNAISHPISLHTFSRNCIIMTYMIYS